MRHLAQLLGQGNLRHIKHPVVKQNVKKHRRIVGSGTPAMKKDRQAVTGSGCFGPERGVRGPMTPLKYKF